MNVIRWRGRGKKEKSSASWEVPQQLNSTASEPASPYYYLYIDAFSSAGAEGSGSHSTFIDPEVSFMVHHTARLQLDKKDQYGNLISNTVYVPVIFNCCIGVYFYFIFCKFLISVLFK